MTRISKAPLPALRAALSRKRERGTINESPLPFGERARERGKSFSSRLLHWFDRHGRHDLPWQHPRTPYRVWLSEVMLQQTQVAAVIPYFQRFVARFPDLAALAAASEDEVLQLWAGLGYYARGRNLLKAARVIAEQHGGRFPEDFDAVAALPGVGRSTAGAIVAQAFGQRHAILDANARRVLARHGALADDALLWKFSGELLPRARLADYTQAVMDLGANVCVSREPRCQTCPVHDDCAAFRTGRQREFPARRAKPARPLKTASMLLIENARGQILLERRPSPGIWGGLWCLPMPQDWRAYCRDELRIKVTRQRALPTVRHGFTHFELEIRPLRLKTSAASPPGAWFAPASLLNLGLPSPVRRLLTP